MNTWIRMTMAMLATTGSVAAADPEATAVSADETVESQELSIAPLDHVTYPDDRPSWLEQAADLDGATGDKETRHRLIVVSAPNDSPEQARDERELLARAAVITYASGLLGLRIDDFDPMQDGQWDELVTQSYTGPVSQGDTPRYEAAWELTFDAEDRAQLIQAGHKIEVRNRLAISAAAVAGGFVLLLGSGGVLNVLGRRSWRGLGHQRDRGVA